jgi:glutamate-1-semialdehyde 2,1-aminomutase
MSATPALAGTTNTDRERQLERALGVTSSPRWDLDKRFPLVVDRAEGAHVWDLDGTRYTDLTSCSGAAPLGSGRPEVIEAMIAELSRSGGIAPATVSRTRTDVAELLVAAMPCAERVVFLRTGSCATTAAARAARVSTGRPVLLTAGYHGWHDWQLQYKPDMRVEGRDPATIDFGYDLDVLAGLLREHSGAVAGVFLTPEVNFFPPEFAHSVEELTREHGALFMLDEIILSLRYAAGGYHGHHGLTPDLITMSKGIANGTALSAVLGRAEVLEALEHTYVGNTYQRETTPFAAALASLPIMTDPATLTRVHQIGTTVMDGLNALFDEFDIAAVALRHPAVFHVVFDDVDLGQRCYAGLRRAGFLAEFGGTHMLSHAMSDSNVADLLLAFRSILEETQSGPGGSRDRSALSRPLWEPAVAFGQQAFGATRRTVERWWQPPFDD